MRGPSSFADLKVVYKFDKQFRIDTFANFSCMYLKDPLLHSSLIYVWSGFRNSIRKSVVLNIAIALERAVSNLLEFISSIANAASSNSSITVPVLGLWYDLVALDSSPMTNSNKSS